MVVVVILVTCVCSRGPIKEHKSKTTKGKQRKKLAGNFLVLVGKKLKRVLLDQPGWKGDGGVDYVTNTSAALLL